jgi:translation elongation factor EF-4
MYHTDETKGFGVDKVLQAIIERIPPPATGLRTDPVKALLFDSSYDRYRGVISLVSVQSGSLHKGDRIVSSHTRRKYDVVDVGIMHPEASMAHLRGY